MNWFKGDISEAVQLSKGNNLIFVVAIFGNDETSKNLEVLTAKENIKKELENSNNFVCVRIESGSETYTNFVQIYQLVPVPSIFFIGQNGTPIEVVTGVIKSENEIGVKIEQILSNAGKNLTTSSSSRNFIQAEQNSSVSQQENNKATNSIQSEDLVCENDVCIRSSPKKSPEPENKTFKENPNESNVKKVLKTTSADPISAPDAVSMSQGNSIDHEDQLKLARKRIQEKQKERETEEARQVKEQELERRKSGKEVQKLQMDQKDQELLQLKEQHKRAKMEEQAARQSILQKIASDRAERAIRFNPITNQTQPVQSSNQPPAKSAAVEETSLTRIQFRTPDGQLYTNSFNVNDTFTAIQAYVLTEIIPNSGLRNFSLATTFPRKEFSDDDKNITLLELGLFPSALIMIISNNKMNPASEAVAKSGGMINLIKSLVWSIFTPILSGFSYIGSWFRGQPNNSSQSEGVRKRASEEDDVNDHDTAKKRNLDRLLKSTVVNDGASTSNNDKFGTNGNSSSGGAYLRPGGNVHRLKDSKKDDDDDNATWNGNSTQQQ